MWDGNNNDVREAMEKRVIKRFEVSGEYLDACYRVTVFPSEEGIVVLGTDITEQKKLEKAIHESEEKYSKLFNSMDEGFCIIEVIFDPSGIPVDYRFIETNPIFEKQTGLRNVKGKLISDLVPDNEEYLMETYGKVALTRKAIRFKNETKALNRWFDVYAFPIGEPDFYQVAIIFNDITQQKKNEEALRDSEEMLRTITENSHDGINLLDLKTRRYSYMSPAQIAMTGFSAEELNNISLEEAYERVHPDDREISVVQQRLIAEGLTAPTTFEYRWRVKNGEYRWLSDSRKLVRDAQGNPIAIVGISRDITDRKKAEEKLRESEQRFRAVHENSLDRFTILRPLYNDTGEIVDFTYVYQNA